MLDRLARNAAEVVPIIFSQILTCEEDGSFVCRAVHHEYGLPEEHQKNRVLPQATWPHFSRAFTENAFIPINRTDSALNAEERYALGLDFVRRIWLFPLQDLLENVGVLVLGENRNGASSLARNQVELVMRIAEQATLAI